MDTDTPTAPEGQEFFPAWRLELADPDKSGTIAVALTGTKNHDPTGDAAVLSREGVSYRFNLWSNLDTTREDTHEPLFAPDVLPHLAIPCPRCGNRLTILAPPPRPKKFKSYPTTIEYSRAHVICQTCQRESQRRARERTKVKRKE